MAYKKCTSCKQPTSLLELGGNGECVDCREIAYDMLSEEEKKPDFIKAINL